MLRGGDGAHAAPLGFHLQPLPLSSSAMDRPLGHSAELPICARSEQDQCRPHPAVPPSSSSPRARCSPAAKPRHCLYLLENLISCISQLQSSRLDSWKSRKPVAAQALLHAGCSERGCVPPQESQHTQCPPQHSPALPWGHAWLVQDDAQLCRMMPSCAG